VFLKTIKKYKRHLVVAVECMFTWYWIADLCARENIAFVLGHALYMKAIHGGKAKNDRIDAHKIAVLLRGAMIPFAYVYPKKMRATRDLLRRRTRLVRQRGLLLAHVQNTNYQYNLPDIGKKIAYKGNREGVAERFPEGQEMARNGGQTYTFDKASPLTIFPISFPNFLSFFCLIRILPLA